MSPNKRKQNSSTMGYSNYLNGKKFIGHCSIEWMLFKPKMRTVFVERKCNSLVERHPPILDAAAMMGLPVGASPVM